MLRLYPAFPLLRFPDDILYTIAASLDRTGLNSLLQTNHRLHTLLTPLLHSHLAQDKDYVLLWAAGNGREVPLRLAIDKGANLSSKGGTGEGYTALHLAALHGHEAILNILLDNGADTAVTDKEGQTPLQRAASVGCEATARRLVERGANLSARGGLAGQTPLHFVAALGSDVIVRLLLDHGAGIDDKNEYSDTPLQLAVSHGRETTVKLLLERGADTYATLHAAARHRLVDVEIARIILEKGVDINARRYNETALHLATSNNRKPLVELLLQYKIDTNARNSDNATALHIATLRDREEIVKLLLEAGIDKNARNNRDETALHIAARHNYDLTELLLKHKIDVNARDRKNETALHVAVRLEWETIARLLLENGIDINARNCEGDTVLHLAVNNRDETMVKLLLEKGAEINAVGGNGMVPLQLAVANDDEVMVEILLGAGADLVVLKMRGDPIEEGDAYKALQDTPLTSFHSVTPTPLELE